MNIIEVCVIEYPGQVEAGNITFRQPGNDILIDTWNVAGVPQPTEAYLNSLIPSLLPTYLLNQFKSQSIMWIDALLLSTAITNSFESELDFISYGLSTNLQEKGTARNYIAWRDAVNATRLSIIAGIQNNGNPIPTQSQFLALLPAIPSNPPAFVPTGIISVKSILVTSTSTYTPSTGLVGAYVRIVGGGGAGGNAAGGTLGGAAAGGGSSASCSEGYFTAAQIGASLNITIGAGGTVGNQGGTTSFGSLMSVPGGLSGANSANILLALACALGGASPAIGTGGTINTQGTPGGNSCINGVVIGGVSGYGAPSYFGGGGQSRTSAGNGNAGGAYGSGGGGAFATTAATTGGIGAPGCVQILEYIGPTS